MEKTKVGVETTLASYILGQKVRELTIAEFEDYIGFLKEKTSREEVEYLFEHGEKAIQKLVGKKSNLYILSNKTILTYQSFTQVLDSATDGVDMQLFSHFCELSSQYRDECKPNHFSEC